MQNYPLRPNYPSRWADSYQTPFESFSALVSFSARVGLTHWAVVSQDDIGLSAANGSFQSTPPTMNEFDSLSWRPLDGYGWLGVQAESEEAIISDFSELALSLLQSSKKEADLRDMVSLADSLPFLASYIDRDFRYGFMNQEYERVFHQPRETMIGKCMADIIGEDLFENVRPLILRVLQGEKLETQVNVIYDLRNEKAKEHCLSCSFVPRKVEEDIVGAYISVREQTAIQTATQALKNLHAITASNELELNDKIHKILQLGCDLFDLPFGIVSHVQGQNYQIAYCCSPDGELEEGVEFELGNCYCVHTLARGEVTGFYHAGLSEIATHPCYQTFQLEAYLGVSVKVNGEVWGTLNFSSPAAREADFSDDEYELVKLFGQWIGEELSRAVNTKSLSDAEKQYRLILESVHDGIVGLDQDGNISFANSSAASITGYDVQELVGQRFVSLLSSPDRLRADGFVRELQIRRAVRQGEHLADIDAEFYRKDGSSFFVKFSCTPIEGQAGGSVLAFQNVTEQKAAQDALREQMEMFRSLFMDAPEAIVVVDQDRLISMVNPHALSLFQYSEADLIGRKPDFLYADQTAYKEMGVAYEDPDSPDLHEYRMAYKRANGQHFIAENVRSKILDKNGEFRGYIIHARDITERLRIEEDIYKARNRLSIATKSAGIGVWELDLLSQALIWDERMYELYGLPVPDTLGPLDYPIWERYVHPEDLKRARAIVERAIDERTDLDMDFRIIRADGELRHIKANAQVLRDENDVPTYLLGVNFDITERYNTEEVLKNAREEAVRASQAKSNFLATMSHEIRTPLNGVLGMAEILSNTKLTKHQQSQLDIIRSSGESLLDLINEILDFSKIEAGHLKLELIDFDLEKLVYDLSRLLIVRAEAKDIDLLVQFELEGDPVLRGDAYRIRQILTNLVGNAIKFTEAGQVTIRVTGKVEPEYDACNVVLSVQDTGIGIAEEAQGQLFQVFTQADSSTTRRFGGTGLGLAITKQLVDLMGGDIELESEVGVGTCFTVSLPLSPSSDVLLPQEDKAEISFERILVVDDNETNLSITQGQLEQYGLRADLESNPVTAIDRVMNAVEQGKPYRLMVLDYLMPEFDGLSVGRAIKDMLPDEKRPKILMMSSAGLLDQDQLIEAGVQVCINKPSSAYELKLGMSKAMHSGTGVFMLSGHNERFVEEGADRRRAYNFEGIRVLVAEDMAANVAVVKGMLGQHGAIVEVAANGLEAIEKWQQLIPDIILMDLHMPIMDGITAIKEIRNMEVNTAEHVPILALTAEAQPERVLEVEMIGGDGYISKPFRRQELLLAIDRALSHQEGGGEQDVGDVSLSEDSLIKDGEALDISVLEGLEELLGGQVNDIVEAFIEDAESVFNDFSKVVSQDDDMSKLYHPAHSLKSVSANVGAMRLSELAATLEKEAKVEQVTDGPAQVAELEREFAKVKECLTKLGRLG